MSSLATAATKKGETRRETSKQEVAGRRGGRAGDEGGTIKVIIL